MKKTINKNITTNKLIGGHVSTAGGYIHALNRLLDIGGNCMQIFSSNPRSYSIRKFSDEEIKEYLKHKNVLGITSVYFHAVYLINLADPSKIGKLSTINLINELNLASKVGVKGSIVHLGSFKGGDKNYDVLIKNIKEILEKTPEDTYFIIENAGNNKIACTLEEIGLIVKRIANPRVKICLDTCHMWATGYDISTETKFEEYFKNFDRLIGIKRLELFQINDSKDEFGSFHDKHENLGLGTIPTKMFELILNKPQTGHLPMILEVPGFDKLGPDKKNVDILKNMVR